jgi:hypothetical protein
MSLEELATKQPDDDNDEDEVILKPKKPKRVCSEKQLDALKLNRAKAAALRTEEADTKKLKKAIDLVEKSTISQLNPSGSVETAKSKIPDPKLNDLKKPIKDTHKPVDKPDSDISSSEEEEVVVVKKKKVVEKPKKKKKVITIEISDTESEEEDEPVVQKPLPSSLPTRKMITLQNRKSLIKVHKPAEPVFNMFCD